MFGNQPLKTCTFVFLLILSLCFTGVIAGDTLSLPAQTVAPGEDQLSILLGLPPGYKLNHEAPTTVKVTFADTKVLAAKEKPEFACPPAAFPLSLPVTAKVGQTRVQLDLNLSYCKSGPGGLCLVKEVRLNLPVRVDRGSSNHRISVSYRMKE
jgi:hypothetical protein